MIRWTGSRAIKRYKIHILDTTLRMARRWAVKSFSLILGIRDVSYQIEWDFEAVFSFWKYRLLLRKGRVAHPASYSWKKSSVKDYESVFLIYFSLIGNSLERTPRRRVKEEGTALNQTWLRGGNGSIRASWGHPRGSPPQLASLLTPWPLLSNRDI